MSGPILGEVHRLQKLGKWLTDEDDGVYQPLEERPYDPVIGAEQLSHAKHRIRTLGEQVEHQRMELSLLEEAVQKRTDLLGYMKDVLLHDALQLISNDSKRMEYKQVVCTTLDDHKLAMLHQDMKQLLQKDQIEIKEKRIGELEAREVQLLKVAAEKQERILEVEKDKFELKEDLRRQKQAYNQHNALVSTLRTEVDHLKQEVHEKERLLKVSKNSEELTQLECNAAKMQFEQAEQQITTLQDQLESFEKSVESGKEGLVAAVKSINIAGNEIVRFQDASIIAQRLSPQWSSWRTKMQEGIEKIKVVLRENADDLGTVDFLQSAFANLLKVTAVEIGVVKNLAQGLADERDNRGSEKEKMQDSAVAIHKTTKKLLGLVNLGGTSEVPSSGVNDGSKPPANKATEAPGGAFSSLDPVQFAQICEKLADDTQEIPIEGFQSAYTNLTVVLKQLFNGFQAVDSKLKKVSGSSSGNNENTSSASQQQNRFNQPSRGLDGRNRAGSSAMDMGGETGAQLTGVTEDLRAALQQLLSSSTSASANTSVGATALQEAAHEAVQDQQEGDDTVTTALAEMKILVNHHTPPEFTNLVSSVESIVQLGKSRTGGHMRRFKALNQELDKTRSDLVKLSEEKKKREEDVLQDASFSINGSTKMKKRNVGEEDPITAVLPAMTSVADQIADLHRSMNKDLDGYAKYRAKCRDLLTEIRSTAITACSEDAELSPEDAKRLSSSPNIDLLPVFKKNTKTALSPMQHTVLGMCDLLMKENSEPTLLLQALSLDPAGAFRISTDFEKSLDSEKAMSLRMHFVNNVRSKRGLETLWPNPYLKEMEEKNRLEELATKFKEGSCQTDGFFVSTPYDFNSKNGGGGTLQDQQGQSGGEVNPAKVTVMNPSNEEEASARATGKRRPTTGGQVSVKSPGKSGASSRRGTEHNVTSPSKTGAAGRAGRLGSTKPNSSSSGAKTPSITSPNTPLDAAISSPSISSRVETADKECQWEDLSGESSSSSTILLGKPPTNYQAFSTSRQSSVAGSPAESHRGPEVATTVSRRTSATEGLNSTQRLSATQEGAFEGEPVQLVAEVGIQIQPPPGSNIATQIPESVQTQQDPGAKEVSQTLSSGEDVGCNTDLSGQSHGSVEEQGYVHQDNVNILIARGIQEQIASALEKEFLLRRELEKDRGIQTDMSISVSSLSPFQQAPGEVNTSSATNDTTSPTRGRLASVAARREKLDAERHHKAVEKAGLAKEALLRRGSAALHLEDPNALEREKSKALFGSDIDFEELAGGSQNQERVPMSAEHQEALQQARQLMFDGESLVTLWNDEKRKGNLPRTTNAFIERLIEKAKKTAALGPDGLRAVSPPRMCQTTLFQPDFGGTDSEQLEQQHRAPTSDRRPPPDRRAQGGKVHRPESAGKSEMREITLPVGVGVASSSGSREPVKFPSTGSGTMKDANAPPKWEGDRLHEVDLGSGRGTMTPIMGPDGKIATHVVLDPEYKSTPVDANRKSTTGTRGAAPIAPKRVRRKDQVQAIHEYISTHVDRHFGQPVEDPKHVELRKIVEQQNQQFSPEEYLAMNKAAGGARYHSPTRLRQIEAEYPAMNGPRTAGSGTPSGNYPDGSSISVDARRGTVTPIEFLSQQQRGDSPTRICDESNETSLSQQQQQPGPNGTREPMARLVPQTKANIKRPHSSSGERLDVSDIAAQVCGDTSRITSTLKTMSPAPRPASATLIRNNDHQPGKVTSLRPNRALPGSSSRPMSASKKALVSQVSSKPRVAGGARRPLSSSAKRNSSSATTFIPSGKTNSKVSTATSSGAGGKTMDLAALGIVHIPDDLADLLANVE